MTSSVSKHWTFLCSAIVIQFKGVSKREIIAIMLYIRLLIFLQVNVITLYAKSLRVFPFYIKKIGIGESNNKIEFLFKPNYLKYQKEIKFHQFLKFIFLRFICSYRGWLFKINSFSSLGFLIQLEKRAWKILKMKLIFLKLIHYSRTA